MSVPKYKGRPTALEMRGFFNGPRGRFITAQALYIAIEELEKINEPLTEFSNINDMKYILEGLFSKEKEILDFMWTLKGERK